MGVFDSLHIGIGGVDATITRETGPLEAGQFDPNTHVWTPALDFTDVPCLGFGLAGGTDAYFQTTNADTGEEADVIVDARTGQVFVQDRAGA